jgi:hypothetical protein
VHDVRKDHVAAEGHDLGADAHGEPGRGPLLDTIDQLLEVAQMGYAERHDDHDGGADHATADEVAMRLELGDPRVAGGNEHAGDEHPGGCNPGEHDRVLGGDPAGYHPGDATVAPSRSAAVPPG